MLLMEPELEFLHEYVSVAEFPETTDVGEREMEDTAGAEARVPVAVPVEVPLLLLPVALLLEPEPVAALQRLLMALPMSCEPMPPPEEELAAEQLAVCACACALAAASTVCPMTPELGMLSELHVADGLPLLSSPGVHVVSTVGVTLMSPLLVVSGAEVSGELLPVTVTVSTGPL